MCRKLNIVAINETRGKVKNLEWRGKMSGPVGRLHDFKSARLLLNVAKQCPVNGDVEVSNLQFVQKVSDNSIAKIATIFAVPNYWWMHVKNF